MEEKIRQRSNKYDKKSKPQIVITLHRINQRNKRKRKQQPQSASKETNTLSLMVATDSGWVEGEDMGEEEGGEEEEEGWSRIWVEDKRRGDWRERLRRRSVISVAVTRAYFRIEVLKSKNLENWKRERQICWRCGCADEFGAHRIDFDWICVW